MPMTDQRKICRNCRHCKPDYLWGMLFIPIIGWVVFIVSYLTQHPVKYSSCLRGPYDDNGYDLITGKEHSDYYYCSTMRRYGGLCGVDGKLWESKS